MKSVLHPSSTLGPLKPTMWMWLLLLQSAAELCPRCVGRGSAARGMGQQANVLSALECICRQERRGQDQEWVGLNWEWATAETDLSGNRSHHSGPPWIATETVIFDFIVGLIRALMLALSISRVCW